MLLDSHYKHMEYGGEVWKLVQQQVYWNVES